MQMTKASSLTTLQDAIITRPASLELGDKNGCSNQLRITKHLSKTVFKCCLKSIHQRPTVPGGPAELLKLILETEADRNASTVKHLV